MDWANSLYGIESNTNCLNMSGTDLFILCFPLSIIESLPGLLQMLQ